MRIFSSKSEGSEIHREIDSILELHQNNGFVKEDIIAAIMSTKSLDSQRVARKLTNPGIMKYISKIQ